MGHGLGQDTRPSAPCGLQVQDVSLIFQSAMATSIAAMCAAAGYQPEEALGTTLVTLVIATFVAGVLIMLVGACVSMWFIMASKHAPIRIALCKLPYA